MILRGACIHHDNGLLGACAYDFAEYRKVRLLKENGYNAIRSSHNPCSEAMLRACDELGVLMADEYVDRVVHPQDQSMIMQTRWRRISART